MRILLTLLFGVISLFAKGDVVVSILPQKYFVEKIAGDTVKIDVMVLPGASPASYEPKSSQMKHLENADIYFSIGVPFEKVWLKKFKSQIPSLNIVATDEGVVKRSMHHHDHDEHHEHHEHGEAEHEHHEDHEHATHNEHEIEEEVGCDPKKDSDCYCHEHENGEMFCHTHRGLDPHIWLDPRLVIVQAQNIEKALIKAYPENEELYKARTSSFIKELNALHNDIKDRLKDLKGRKFMVFHPSWGYFAKRYGFEQIPVEKEGKEPKPAELQKLIKLAKEENIKVIFVAPQFSKKSANIIAKESGIKVVELDPLPQDWMKGMEKVVKSFENNI
ncbi:metal ion ABC transporter, periplasmic metal-binding protein [Campylobacter blaseri]|uniref:Cation ABC transporter substrate-binding protein n=1 Tax=Campylobacter blaseri TaxID=2042961 RepID=A0A2P8R3D3_9BACT|nr:zinc ABC transporter substrate-binding protein [Campylobacter blaseri]PSM53003.1 cation ABC transporter substrate-binding protein [Campylobacter blaseri]PSM54470.1 cation ABC transporter substrate-binding protein [Campylobacter blaseri]QKF85286.1 metal ion ABC transporter, periplasmic metal-binding protein [Campylobacter blaseri]